MVEELLWASIGVVALAMLFAYSKTRDPLHPLMYLGPMFIYIYGLGPISVWYREAFFDLLPDQPSITSYCGSTWVCSTEEAGR